MAANYNQFSGRGFQNIQRQSFDLNNANNLEFLVQQEIGHQQGLSPGQAESSGSSYGGSPTPPAPTHQQTTVQPFPARLQSGYFPTSPIGMPQSTASPVSPRYAVSDALDTSLNYQFDFNDMSMSNINGMLGARNNSADLLPLDLSGDPLPQRIGP